MIEIKEPNNTNNIIDHIKNNKSFEGLKKKEPRAKIFFSKKILGHRTTKENPVLFLSRKSLRFVVEKGEEYNKRKLPDNIDVNEGRWTKEEHDKFLDGIVQYGINWKKVKTLISSRTSIQVRSHAQKFFRKLKMCKDEKLGIDFTDESISSIRDMIFQIKTINNNYNIKNIFKYLSDKFDNMKKPKKYDGQIMNYNINFVFDNDKKETNNLLENNNNLNINSRNEMNTPNNINQMMNLNHQVNNNINSNIPLNNNILLNNNINFNSNNFYEYQNLITNNLLTNECKNILLMNNLNYNNNDLILNNIFSYLNNPNLISIISKLITLLKINNTLNFSNDDSNNRINTNLNGLGLNNTGFPNNNLYCLNLPYSNLNNMNLNTNLINTNLININKNLNEQNIYKSNLNIDTNLFNNLLNQNIITNNNVSDVNKSNDINNLNENILITNINNNVNDNVNNQDNTLNVNNLVNDLNKNNIDKDIFNNNKN